MFYVSVFREIILSIQVPAAECTDISITKPTFLLTLLNLTPRDLKEQSRFERIFI